MNWSTAHTHLLVSTIFFGGGFLFAVLGLRSGKSRPTLRNLVVMGAGFLFQTLFLMAQGRLHGSCPITCVPEILIFVAWSMVLLYFVIGGGYRLSLLGVFTSPLVFLLQLFALLPGRLPTVATVRDGPVDYWVELHATVSLLSYGAFALAAVAGVMYLVQERLLSRRDIKTLFYQLPPINSLATAIFRLSLFGFIVLTIGLVSAFFMNEMPGPLKLVLICIVWLVYGALLLLQARRGLAPRTTAWAAALVFLLPLATLWVVGRR